MTLKKIMQRNKEHKRDISVPSGSAQITTLLQPGAAEVRQEPTIMDKLAAIKNGQDVRWMVCYLMAVAGLRVSEALGVRWSHVTRDGAVLVAGLKGSRSKAVYAVELTQYFLKCRVNKVDPFERVSRWKIHRYVKEHSLGEQFGGKKKCSTTHVFRHKFVESLREVSGDERQIADSVGHQSVNSTKYYGKG